MWKTGTESKRIRYGIRTVCLCSTLVFTASSMGVLSREEALAAAYPSARIRSERVFLTEQQRLRAAELARVSVPSPLIARYVAFKEDRVVGRAYVDTHVVRTKKESLLICLDESGKLQRIEVTAFLEPPEYLASPDWYAQYTSRELSDELSLNRAIRPIVGATLTSLAANRAVRRILAIDQVLQKEPQSGQ
ncbi:MAG: FMN-binding protein [Candidatus Aminicenantes bacterium]|nr:FMN-binding protein [Candidatus Aminicenantes bacterium]